MKRAIIHPLLPDDSMGFRQTSLLYDMVSVAVALFMVTMLALGFAIFLFWAIEGVIYLASDIEIN